MVKDPVCGKEIGYKRFNECSEYKAELTTFVLTPAKSDLIIILANMKSK